MSEQTFNPDDWLSNEDRIFVHFSDEPFFTYDQVKERFPDINDRSIYRALNKLEATHRIRFLKFLNRKKVYTTAGVSPLPVIKNANGEYYPISVLLKNAAQMYEAGKLKRLEEVNDIWILVANLFVIALNDDPLNDKRRDVIMTYKELMKMRAVFLSYIENIDAITQHPTMQGDVDLFIKVFTNTRDSEVPTPEELLKFRVWLSKEKGNE